MGECTHRHELAAVDSLDDSLEWFALYTKSRHEKTVAEQLNHRGFETFLPLRSIVKRWSDRRKLIETPLFAGYVFVHMLPYQRLEALRAAGAVSFVGYHAQAPWPVPESDIAAVQRFVEGQLKIDPFPFLRVGQRVRVRRGSLRGVEGFIVRKGRHCRLVVSIELMQQSVAVEIDEELVEPLRG